MFSYTFVDLYVLKNLNVDVGFTYDLLLWAYMVNFLTYSVVSKRRIYVSCTWLQKQNIESATSLIF